MEYSTQDETFDFNLLFQYRVNAGTVFFAGYDDHYQQSDWITGDRDRDAVAKIGIRIPPAFLLVCHGGPPSLRSPQHTATPRLLHLAQRACRDPTFPLAKSHTYSLSWDQ